MPLIPLDCPSCGANLTVDSNKDAAICEYCGKPYIVKDAIVHNYINNVTNITADTVNVYSQKDFTIKAGVLEKYNGEAVDVVVPNNVKVIGQYAFRELAIESVVVPDSVKKICAGAFGYCQSLLSVTLPDTGIAFENSDKDGWCCGPFMFCSSLEQINIPYTNSEICAYMFHGCKSLKSIVLPDNITSIGVQAFEGCNNLSHIEISNNVETIECGAFSNCSSLTSIVIPDRVTLIGSGAFCGCKNLSKVTIPDSVTRIGSNVFKDCDNPLTLITSVGTFEIDPNDFGLESEVVSIEDMKKKYLMKQNRCTSCGGDFTGLIIKKCSKCGKSKDY